MLSSDQTRIIHCVSVSTGKDSSATAVLALETIPREQLRFVTADTGNEHEGFRPYLQYMQSHLGISIEVVCASFVDEIERKATYVRNHWSQKGVPQPAIDRALRALQPTGNPFLDLCVWKGKFPSRTTQFCTQELKTKPLVEHQLSYIERGEADAVWAWQGVRVDESDARMQRLGCSANMVFSKFFEESGAGLFNYRPILRWTTADVFEAMRLSGLTPNPLYSQGMTRVGCMPCINASKDEVLEISKRFPHHIERIEYWERTVAQASKREESSFFPDPHRDAHLNKRGIRNYVEWSQTQHGGQKLDWIRIHEEPAECASAYGLCE